MRGISPPPDTGNTDLNAWLKNVYEALKRLNNIYFTKSEYLDSSAGAGDAGKPVILDSTGKIDSSMIP